MGEIADAMLDGTLCECCGCYIDDGGARASLAIAPSSAPAIAE